MRIAVPLCLGALLPVPFRRLSSPVPTIWGPATTGTKPPKHEWDVPSDGDEFDVQLRGLRTGPDVLNSIFTSNAGGSDGGGAAPFGGRIAEKDMPVLLGPVVVQPQLYGHGRSAEHLERREPDREQRRGAVRHVAVQRRKSVHDLSRGAGAPRIMPVEEILMVEDTFGDFPSRDLTLNSINGAFNAANPEPGTFGLMGAGLLAASVFLRGRR